MPPLGFSALSQLAISEVLSAALSSREDSVYFIGLEVNSGTYTDIASSVNRFHSERRLANLFQPLEDGRLTIELDNTNGNFSPSNALSPHYPNLVPGRKILVHASYQGSSYNIFRGSTLGYSLQPGIASRRAILEASDAARRISETFITTSLFINSDPGSMFTAIMSACNVASFAADAFGDLIPYAWFQNVTAGTAIQRLIEFGDYSALIDAAGTVQLRNRQAGWKTGVVASYSVVGTDGFYAMDYNINADSIINRATVGGKSRRAATSQQTLAWLLSAPLIPASSALGFWLAYVDPNEPTVGAPAMSLQSPVSSSDWKLNTAADGSGSDRTATGALNITMFGESAVCSLYNGSPDIVYLTKFQIRGYSIQQQPAIAVQNDATSSQNLYGKREFSLDNEFISLQSYADSYAALVVSNRKDPLPDINVSLKNVFPDVFTRELGDLVGLVESHSAVNSQWSVVAVTHDVALLSGLEHVMKMGVKFYSNRPFLVLDDATLGVLDGTRELAF